MRMAEETGLWLLYSWCTCHFYHFHVVKCNLMGLTTKSASVAPWPAVSLGAHAPGVQISYPESSGFLVSGWAPGETLENSKKFNFFDWLLYFGYVTASIVLPQKSCSNKIPVPQSLSWRATAGQRAWGLWVRDWRAHRRYWRSCTCCVGLASVCVAVFGAR